jgi:hypothetical protein
MRAVVLLATGCSSLLPQQNPFPSYVISPGVKLAYTFGPRGGWTYGGEITAPIKHGDDLHAIVALGPAFNFAWTSHGTTYVRFGLDVVSWFVGLEGGPTIVSDRTGTHFGVGVQAWGSSIWVVGEYTHTFVVGAPALDELGAYGKLPLCFACASSGDGGLFFGHHDHH